MRVTRGATGIVRRLNAAVVVNHKVSVDAKGKTVTTPLTPEELDKLTALVQQGIGFNKERGDSVRVINAPFRVETAPAAEDLPFWQKPWVQDLLRAGLAPGALALVALVIVFTLLRPALKAALAPPPAPPPGTQLDEVVADDGPMATLPALDAPRINSKLEAARRLARDNPAAVAHIVSGWVSGESA